MTPLPVPESADLRVFEDFLLQILQSLEDELKLAFCSFYRAVGALSLWLLFTGAIFSFSLTPVERILALLRHARKGGRSRGTLVWTVLLDSYDDNKTI